MLKTLLHVCLAGALLTSALLADDWPRSSLSPAVPIYGWTPTTAR
jgi:hypothetical protein